MIKSDIQNPFNAPVYHEENLSSTMDFSRQLAAQGAPHGTVIIADFQEKGRGRGNNRTWEMERGDDLAFTVLLRFQSIKNISSALTLRAGLALSLAIEDFLPCLKSKVMVKWPNDIIINDKKTAGILCEADGGNVFLGIGVNLRQRVFPEYLQKATSIYNEQVAGSSEGEGKREEGEGRREKGRENIGRFVLLERILFRLYDELENTARLNWKACLEKRLYKIGEDIVFFDGAADSRKEVSGQLAGIGENGELLIFSYDEREIKSYITGEIKL